MGAPLLALRVACLPTHHPSYSLLGFRFFSFLFLFVLFLSWGGGCRGAPHNTWSVGWGAERSFTPGLDLFPVSGSILRDGVCACAHFEFHGKWLPGAPARRWYIQEAPKKLPGGQISWYFKPFWSPGAPGLHFEVQGFIFQEAPKRIPGGQIQWYFEPFWSPGAPGLHFEVQGSISSSRAQIVF